jgi:multidrug resistance efflux pump
VEKTKTLLAYSQIVAPFDGVVARRLVNRGDLVQAPTATRTTPLFTVERIDTIRVFCDVPENDVPRLHIGDPERTSTVLPSISLPRADRHSRPERPVSGTPS